MQVGSLVVLQMKVELPKNGHWGLGRLTRLLPNCDTDIVIASNVSAFRGIIDSDGTIRSLQPMTGVCIVDAVYTVRQ
ncbi:MAG: hypothetical protein J6575_03430 [Bifidobacterium sp.]|nr:hypothetical protein [Bifidobacterium sp.]